MSQPQTPPPEETARWSEIFTGRLGTLTFVLGLGMGLFAINQFVVATIMPTVVRDIGGVEYYTWAFSLFAIGAIVGSASANPLRQAFGVRRAYAGAGLVLGIGLAGAAFAPDMQTLVAARLIQGIGGGAVASSGNGSNRKIRISTTTAPNPQEITSKKDRLNGSSRSRFCAAVGGLLMASSLPHSTKRLLC